jgi:hypothetical protein
MPPDPGEALGEPTFRAESTVNESTPLVTEYPFESFTVTVMPYVPDTLGEQLTVDVPLFVQPGGRLFHVYV